MINKAIVIVCVALSYFATCSSHADTIRLSNGEWPPYVSKDLKHHGFFSHIVKEAFALEGIEVEYEFFPWKRSYRYAADGKFDGSLTWAPTPERRKDFHFTEPVTFNTKVFFHLRNKPFDWKTVKDLRGMSIGVTNEYTYGREFDEAVKNKELVVSSVTYDKQNIRKLLLNRIDVFPMEIEVGYNLIHAELAASQTALITNHPKPVYQAAICVVISKKLAGDRAKFLVESFNRGLASLKKSGKYEQIVWNSRQGKYIQ